MDVGQDTAGGSVLIREKIEVLVDLRDGLASDVVSGEGTGDGSVALDNERAWGG